MSYIQKLSFLCMGAALTALCLIAMLSDLSSAVKCFAVFASVDGFWELYRMFKGR